MGFIKNNYLRVFKGMWWLMILIIEMVYIIDNYESIQFNPNVIDYIIIITFVIILFMPLVSEVTVFGMGIKKEMKETKEEMKSEIMNMKLHLIQNKNFLNSEVNNYYGDGLLPSKDNIEEDKEREKSEAVSPTTSVDFSIISESQLNLFKSRYLDRTKYIRNT